MLPCLMSTSVQWYYSVTNSFSASISQAMFMFFEMWKFWKLYIVMSIPTNYCT